MTRLFEYLKWRKECKYKKNIAKLTGEICGLKEKVCIYKEANSNLVFSNHREVAKFTSSLAQKEAELACLKDICEK